MVVVVVGAVVVVVVGRVEDDAADLTSESPEPEHAARIRTDATATNTNEELPRNLTPSRLPAPHRRLVVRSARR